jgi:hypothetical protein
LYNILTKVHTSKHLSDNFLIQNGVKQEDALWPLLFNFVLDSAIGKIQENQMEMKLRFTWVKETGGAL